LRPQIRAEVLPTAVREEDHDVAALHALSDTAGAVDNRAGGNTGKDAFLPGKLTGGDERVVAGDDYLPVEDGLVEDGG
jgi:hypothetical protein